MTEIDERKNYSIGWWIVLASMAAVFLSSFAAYFFETDSIFYIPMFFSEFIQVLPLLLGFLYLKRTSGIDESFSFRLSPKFIPFAILLPVFAQSFINTVTLPVTAVSDFLFGITEDMSLIKPQGPLELIAGILTICIIGPIIEELLCRGVLMSIFKPCGRITSVFITALIFSMLHFDPQSFVIIFMLGLLLGIIRLFTGSLSACIIAHAANNTLAFILELSPEPPMWFSTAYITVSLILFPLLLYLFLKLSGVKYKEHENVMQKRMSVSEILCIIAYASYAVFLLLVKLVGFFEGITYTIR